MGRLGVVDKAPEVAEEATNMALDRDETARLFMASLLSRDGYDVDGDAVKAVQAADALRAALVAVKPEAVAPAPSPAARPAPYVPKCGDVVTASGLGARLVVSVRQDGVIVSREIDDGCGRVLGGECFGPPDLYHYLRPATSSERAAAGLPPVDESAPACHGECDTPPPGRCSTGCAPDERPAFDEAKERKAAVAARDAWLGDYAVPGFESAFVAGWLARARVAAKGGA